MCDEAIAAAPGSAHKIGGNLVEVTLAGTPSRKPTVHVGDRVRLTARLRAPAESFETVRWRIEAPTSSSAMDQTEVHFTFLESSRGKPVRACVHATIRDDTKALRATTDTIELMVKSVKGVSIGFAMTRDKHPEDNDNFRKEARGFANAVGGITPEDLGLGIDTHTGQLLLDGLKAATSKHGPIQNVAIYAHGSHDAIYADDDQAFYITPPTLSKASQAATLAELEKAVTDGAVKFTADAVILILACSCGASVPGGPKSLGQEMAERLKVTVIAGFGSASHNGWNKVSASGWRKFSRNASGEAKGQYVAGPTVGFKGSDVKQAVLDPRFHMAVPK